MRLMGARISIDQADGGNGLSYEDPVAPPQSNLLLVESLPHHQTLRLPKVGVLE